MAPKTELNSWNKQQVSTWRYAKAYFREFDPADGCYKQ